MQETSVFWLRTAALLYFAGLLQTLYTVIRKRSAWFGPAFAAFCIAAVFHFVSLVEGGMAAGRFPADNFYESASLCAFLIALVFLFVYWRYEFQSLSVVLFPLVFVMTLVAAMQSPVPRWTTATARDTWLLLHVASILLGYAALLLTAAASVFYLVQERHLKRKKPSLWADRLPPLGTLDGLISSSMGFGFALVTVGVVSGSTWAFIEWGTTWIADPKIFIAFATWGFCLLMVFFRVTAGWRGRKAAIMSIVVVGSLAATWATHSGLRKLLVE